MGDEHEEIEFDEPIPEEDEEDERSSRLMGRDARRASRRACRRAVPEAGRASARVVRERRERARVERMRTMVADAGA